MIELPPHIRLRRRGGLLFAFNYGEESWSMPGGFEPVVGNKIVPAQDIAIFRESSPRLAPED